MLARMRTAPEAYKLIKEADPETAVTLHYIRTIVRTLEAVCAAMGGKETRAEYYLPAFSLGLMQLDSARCKLADVLNTALKEQQGVKP